MTFSGGVWLPPWGRHSAGTFVLPAAVALRIGNWRFRPSDRKNFAAHSRGFRKSPPKSPGFVYRMDWEHKSNVRELASFAHPALVLE